MLDDLSIQQLQAFLREDSQRAERLRQSMPFLDVLTPAERRQLFDDALA